MLHSQGAILPRYDYVIVGSGLFGSIFAREMVDFGRSCLVLERRGHIGGNCYTREERGIHVHQYGPHIFHTESDKVWRYMNRWTTFNDYTHKVRVNYRDRLLSFPINLITLRQLWGGTTPEEAERKLQEVRIDIDSPQNLEEWILSQVGEELYETFVYGYTKKQWGREPRELPSSIIRRLPIRLTANDNYFNDRYQGIPIGGYTRIFEQLLEGIPVETGVDYLEAREEVDRQAKRVVYTGPIDEFFGCDKGALEWRSLRFESQWLENTNYQNIAIVNYTAPEVPYTRIVEHKHFDYTNQPDTLITMEFPQKWKPKMEKYYPVNDHRNTERYRSYKARIDPTKYVFGGRLAEYKYYDMHQVVSSALAAVERDQRMGEPTG